MSNSIQIYQPELNNQISEHFYQTKLAGLFYFQAKKSVDKRGFFSEIVNLPELESVIKQPFPIKQVNHARSKTNVVRGLHAEGWNKLVTVTNGLIFSAIVDIRPNSDTFKQAEYFHLSCDQQAGSANGLFISQGLANSVCVLQGPASYLYLVDKLYSERDEKDNLSVSIFDNELAVNWPISKEKMILSQRDKQAVSLEKILEKNGED